MSNTAVVARHTHPAAQGNHSYSLALVQYDTEEQLEALKRLFGFRGEGLPEPMKHNYQWYGGNQFDLIATFPTPPTTLTPQQYSVQEDMNANKHSVGDHRWVGYYTAEELLKEQNTV